MSPPISRRGRTSPVTLIFISASWMEPQSSAIRHDTNTDREPGSPPRATVEPVEDSDLVSERSNIEEPVARHRASFLVKESGNQLCRKASVASLPNDVLLEIFSSYIYVADDASLDAWHTLVHVCQRWRYVIFASPRHLNLRLRCTNKTPVKKRLRIWPELPIVVSCHSSSNASLPGVSNIDAALKCIDRVCEINLFGVTIPLLKRFGAMNVPFPALTCLRLSYKSDDDGDFSSLPPLPELFLGGIAPCLRLLHLDGIPFPAVQKLLLSTTNLITLRLERIPSIGATSPEAMAICLSTLTKLEELALEFRHNYQSGSSQSSQHPPPVTPTVLPALTSLWFRGCLAYLEILVSQIRLPLLENVDITLLRENALGSSRFREFISRIKTLELLQRADIAFQDESVNITLSPPEGPADCRTLEFGILWGKSDHQPMYLSQFCRYSLPPLPTLEHLYMRSSFSGGYHFIKTIYSLDLLRPFASVKDLHVSKNAELRVTHALHLLSQESKAEVLPSLKNIFLPESKPSRTIRKIAQFIFTRSLSGRPISIHYRQGGNWVAKVLWEVDN